MRSITALGIPNFPMVQPGDDLVAFIIERTDAAGEILQPNDILLVAQKVVSKSEGRLVRIGDVTPSARALELAEQTGKDPRAVEVILSDSNEVVRARPGLLVMEQKSGWVCANAGVDRSNIKPATEEAIQRQLAKQASQHHATEQTPEHTDADSAVSVPAPEPHLYDDDEVLALLPVDADASAARIRQGLAVALNLADDDAPAVIITDTHGRAWRTGQAGICIGCAGIPPVWDQRGGHDLFGYELKGSEEAIADELAGMAGLLMGGGDEGTPVVIVRGFQMPPNAEPAPATSMQRPRDKDAFR